MTKEWTQYFHEPEWHDLEVLHAHFVGQRFARHSHEYFVIGYIEQGVQTYCCRGARHLTPAGRVFLVNPDEIHTGEAATASGYIYRTLYPRPALMEQVAAEVTGHRALPFFRRAVVHDRKLTRLLTGFHRKMAESRSRLAIETFLTEALVHLIAHHTDARVRLRLVGKERTAVRRARDYLDAHFATSVTLSQLSVIANLSPFHLARAFAQEVGLPPHMYLENRRTQQARQLLDAGNAIAEVAVAVGYSDQSHLTRRFKRSLGITPGQYVRAHRINSAPALPVHALPRALQG